MIALLLFIRYHNCFVGFNYRIHLHKIFLSRFFKITNHKSFLKSKIFNFKSSVNFTA